MTIAIHIHAPRCYKQTVRPPSVRRQSRRRRIQTHSSRRHRSRHAAPSIRHGRGTLHHPSPSNPASTTTQPSAAEPTHPEPSSSPPAHKPSSPDSTNTHRRGKPAAYKPATPAAQTVTEINTPAKEAAGTSARAAPTTTLRIKLENRIRLPLVWHSRHRCRSLKFLSNGYRPTVFLPPIQTRDSGGSSAPCKVGLTENKQESPNSCTSLKQQRSPYLHRN